MSENEVIEIENYRITLFILSNVYHTVQVKVEHINEQPIMQEDIDYFNNILQNLSKYQTLITGLKTLLIDLGFIQGEEIQSQTKQYSCKKVWKDKQDDLLHTSIRYEPLVVTVIPLSEVAELIKGIFKWEKILKTATLLKSLF